MMALIEVGTAVAAITAAVTFPLFLRWGEAEARVWQPTSHTLRHGRLLGGIGAVLLGGVLGGAFNLTGAAAAVGATSSAAMSSAVTLGLLAALLMALTVIDLSVRLLPDRLTISLIVAALGFHVVSNQLPLASSLAGLAAGYLGLWLLALIYRRLRGLEPMGRGDFAMLAGVGAWVGWQQLPAVLIIASIGGLIVAGIDQLLAKRPALLTQQIAFGPALTLGAVVGWLSLG